VRSDKRFLKWFEDGLRKRVGDEYEMWASYWWIDYRDFEYVVYLQRQPDDRFPHGLTVRGSAPDILRLRGWKGWNVYRAAARALRALG
jgi:hypothetical protein